MIVTGKENNVCKIIDFAVPYDNRVDAKEMEKIEKYQDLARELRKIWKKRSESYPCHNWSFRKYSKTVEKETG